FAILAPMVLAMVLVIVAGARLVGARGDLGATARESARAAVEAPPASAVARRVGQATALGYGMDPSRLELVADQNLPRGGTSFPRLTTWAAFRNFLSHADDAAFGDAVLRWAERVGVVLYLWLATELVITFGAQMAERLGRSSLRAVLEGLQPRSVALALNAVV